MKPWLTGLSALTLAFALGAPAVSAETPDSNQSVQTAPSASAQSISDQELQTFAVAALKVRAIGDEWQPKIAEADSKEKATEIRMKARDQMVDAVKKEGMSVERYNEITQQVRANPDLAEKVTAHIREAQ